MAGHKLTEQGAADLAAGKVTDPHQRLILELVDAMGQADTDTVMSLCVGLIGCTGSIERALDGVLALKKKGTLQELLRDYLAQEEHD